MRNPTKSPMIKKNFRTDDPMQYALQLRTALVCLLTGWFVHAQALAHDAVWHCSKHTQAAFAEVPASDLEQSFGLSSSKTDTLDLSLNDLFDAYNGQSVVLGQAPLTACFMYGHGPLNQAAAKHIGMNWASLQYLARPHHSNATQIHMVHSEKEMLQCIAKHYPAVGYLSQTVVTSTVGPCF